MLKPAATHGGRPRKNPQSEKSNSVKRFVYAILFFLSALHAQAAEELMSYKYEVDKGLSHNTVRCVIQDSDGFMWFGTADGLNRFDGRQYKIFTDNSPSKEGQIGNNSIYSLAEDDQGRIWVGTARGVYIYSPATETFERFGTRTGDGNGINGTVRLIKFDDPNTIWFGTSGQGLFIYDTKADTLSQTRKYGLVIGDISRASNGIIYAGTNSGRIIEFDTDGNFLREFMPDINYNDRGDRNITALYNDKQTIYCGLGVTELQAIDKKTGQTKIYRLDDTKYSVSHFRKIFPLSEEELLIATDNGLFIFTKSTGKFQPFDTRNLFGISDQSVLDIWRDREGGLWIATEYGGVNYIPRNLRPFGHVIPVGGGYNGGRVVSCFAEDEKHNLWIGTKDGGLIYYYPDKGSMTFYEPRGADGNSISYHNIQSLMLIGSELWIGTFSRGLDVMNTATGRVRNYRHIPGTDNSISDNTVTSLFKDRQGNIYVGTAWGLNKYRPETNDFEQVSQLGNQASVSDMIEDSRGNIWFATLDMGIYRLKPSDGTWSYFYNEPGNKATIPNNRVTSLFEDDWGTIWIGTENGLCRFEYSIPGIVRIDDEKRALPNRMISSIEQDQDGMLWIATSGGIFSFNPTTNTVESRYTKTDGLQSSQFSPDASLAASDGKLYFGSINGFNFFNPDQLVTNDYMPNITITGMRVNNDPVIPKDRIAATSILGKTDTLPPASGTIRLKPGSSNIIIDFVALSYQSPQKNKYSYKLEGWDEKWIETENSASAYYNNLPAGKYTFLVRGSNNDGLWSTQTTALRFEIRPPFYLTTLAYVIYGILILSAILAVYFLITYSQKKRLREYATEQERLSYHSQIDFFTNIAHEIRTPLTLIKVPLEFIISSGEGSPQVKNYLDMMNTNTNNLLNLINQLLEFRKSGEGEYALLVQNQDVKQLLTDICARFNSVVNIGNLKMELNLPEGEVFFNMDADAFSKIANNLISNALKYAKTKIVVSLRMKGHTLELSVSDDGKGIDMNERDKIFDTFYQPEGSKAGSGIGLHLAKLLTEKHGGTIQVANNRDGGAVFTVTLPTLARERVLVGDSVSDAVIPSSHTPEPLDEISEDDKERILLVEDNDEVRRITGEFLEIYYDVRYAANGKQAIDILDRENISLIITDLMMPEMDGYELCEFVKSDIRYSHIPVIQLTAKTSLQDKIKGLEYGSDAYVEKPFSLEFLHTQIDNLLENRRRLRNAYNTPPSAKIEVGNTVYSKKDSEFIEKLNAEIEKYIQKEDISLDHLAESMFMSRSNFYRKIKGLFGVSPNEYVKRYRLKRAASIIARNECRISDVYVKVGFNSASYFTKCFKKYFGVLPKDYAASVNSSSDFDNVPDEDDDDE